MINRLDFEPLDLGVICGGVRCFKTLHAVRLAKLAHDDGYEVYSNIKLSGNGGDWRHHFGRLDSQNSDVCVSQLFVLFDHIEDEHLEDVPKFLVLDEFSDIADSQRWKDAAWTSNVWKQLGKMGFTSYVTNQSFSMTYNRYRDNTNKMVITKRLDETHYTVTIGLQSTANHERYKKTVSYVLNGRSTFELYNTRQRMYSTRKR